MVHVSKTTVLIALLLTLLIGFSYSRVRQFAPRQREIDQLRRAYEDAKREVEQKAAEVAEKEAELKAIESDPAAREAAARQGLRWVREGERVYIVEEPWEVVPVGGARETGTEPTAAPDGPVSPPALSDSAANLPSSASGLTPLVPPDGADAPAASP